MRAKIWMKRKNIDKKKRKKTCFNISLSYINICLYLIVYYKEIYTNVSECV